jgi:hypothetical protein
MTEIPKGMSYRSWRDGSFMHARFEGVKIPDFRPDGIPETGATRAKKYIIMDPAQIRQRYLFQFKLN